MDSFFTGKMHILVKWPGRYGKVHSFSNYGEEISAEGVTRGKLLLQKR